jgi:phosphatidylinositol alpha-1,6-mannosyltransferase
VLTFHGSEVKSFAARPTARLLVGRLIHAADRVTTPSRFTQRLLCERFPVAAGKTIVTRGAPRSSFLKGDAARVRTSDKVVVLSVGRLHPRKGQLHVLEALNQLPEQLASRVEYWVVGRGLRGDYESRMRERAQTSRVPVFFLGNIDDGDLELLYKRADIFALTSVDHGHSVEGFGLAFLEASAFGLPVLGHAVGGVPEAVRDGETGLLVPAGDSAALRDALARLVSDASLRHRLGKAGHAWARRHSWRDSARMLLDGLCATPAQEREPLMSPDALQSA